MCVLHEEGAEHTCIARGGVWARVRCMRRGLGACALHEEETVHTCVA